MRPNGFFFCLRKCLDGIVRMVAPLVIQACALATIGFYAYQNVALEHYYSLPFATMDAQAIMVYDLAESPSYDLVRKHKEESRVWGYRVFVESGGAMEEAKAHGIADPSPSSMDATVFNSRAIGETSLGNNEVLVDEATAKDLGISEKDTINIVQRSTETEKTVVVSAIIPTYDATRGVVGNKTLFTGMEPYELQVYTSDINNNKDANEGTFQAREDAYEFSKMLAHSFLPFASSDALHFAAAILSCAVSFLFFSIAAFRQRKRFFVPLSFIGMNPRDRMLIQLAAMMCILAPTIAISSISAIAILEFAYSIPLSFMLLLSTAALLGSGALLGGITALFVPLLHEIILSRRLRRQGNRRIAKPLCSDRNNI